MSDVDLGLLLDDLADHVSSEFADMPDVIEAGDAFTLEKLPIKARRWTRLDDVVAVVADLKSSTSLGTGKRAASTASIYEAAVGGAARILDALAADDMDIQGDAVVGLFWGDRRYERALCAAITLKTFSAKTLQPALAQKWPSAPPTGFKVGVASGQVLVKRVGLVGSEHQEEVWAGKPVNYAAKTAQETPAGGLIVTGSVWEQAARNDYVAYSCACNGGPTRSIWQEHTITKLPEGDRQREGRRLTPSWCDHCGPEFLDAILAGGNRRENTKELRAADALEAVSLEAKRQADVQRRRSLGQLRGN